MDILLYVCYSVSLSSSCWIAHRHWTHRWYPTKRALPAMLTHGRWGPFGRIPSTYGERSRGVSKRFLGIFCWECVYDVISSLHFFLYLLCNIWGFMWSADPLRFWRLTGYICSLLYSCLIVNWNLRNKIRWNLNQDKKSLQENAFENVSKI